MTSNVEANLGFSGDNPDNKTDFKPTESAVQHDDGLVYYRDPVSNVCLNSGRFAKQYHHLKWEKKFKVLSKKSMGKTCKAICCGNCALYNSAVNARKRALDNDMSLYKLYQGEKDNMCWKAGCCGDKGSESCLKMEAFCTPGGSIEASYNYVQNTRDLQPDVNFERYNKCLSGARWLKSAAGCVPGLGEVIKLGIDVLVVPVKRSMAPAMAVQIKKECSDINQNKKKVYHELAERLEKGCSGCSGHYRVLKDIHVPVQIQMGDPASETEAEDDDDDELDEDDAKGAFDTIRK